MTKPTGQSAQIATQTGSVRWVLRFLFVTCTAVLLVACGGGGRELSGVLTLADIGGEMGSWNDCEGDGGYDDIGPGAFVSVENEEGTKVGAGALRNLTSDDAEWLIEKEFFDSGEAGFSTLQEMEGEVCILAFEIEVDDADVYVVEIGRRGESTYTKSQLQEANWFISLSIGDL